MAFNWTCPHCQHAQAVVDECYSQLTGGVGVSGLAEGMIAYEITSIACANATCRKLTLSFAVGKDVGGSDGWAVTSKTPLARLQLLPRSAAKSQPGYIPAVLVEDYNEACLIRDLSPKASATLARRCLQGMIRDFCNISKPRLIDEIRELEKQVGDGSADRAVSPESVAAIDQVRGIGNIGAHMGRDIGTIVEVDPDEAQILIGLIEMLFDEWYGARERRRLQLEAIARVASAKKIAAKSAAPNGPQSGDGAASLLTEE